MGIEYYYLKLLVLIEGRFSTSSGYNEIGYRIHILNWFVYIGSNILLTKDALRNEIDPQSNNIFLINLKIKSKERIPFL